MPVGDCSLWPQLDIRTNVAEQIRSLDSTDQSISIFYRQNSGQVLGVNDTYTNSEEALHY